MMIVNYVLYNLKIAVMGKILGLLLKVVLCL